MTKVSGGGSFDPPTLIRRIAKQHAWVWEDLVTEGATGDQEEFWLSVLTPYFETGRFYHAWTHIVDGLRELQELRSVLVHPGLVGLAWVCHDIIYDVTRDDNEKASATLCYLLGLRLGLSGRKALIACTMVESTKSHESLDADTRFLLDTDLAVLGYDRARFEAYEEGVRREYSRKYTPQEFSTGRMRWIQSFLKTHSERVYFTDLFEERYGERAVCNLRRSLSQLQAR